MKHQIRRFLTDRVMKVYNSPAGVAGIPYQSGSSLLQWFASTEYARTDYLLHRAAPFREFLVQLGCHGDHDALLTAFLKTHFHHGWRTAALSHLSNKALDKMIRFEGIEIFDSYYKGGKGIVLVNSHFGWPSVALWLFMRKGYTNYYSILGERGVDSLKVAGIRKDCLPQFLSVSRESGTEAFRLLFQAREKLEEGGVVHILGDGQHGRSHVSLPFAGKMRGFRASFAELGLITEAAMIPVFVMPDQRGKAVVKVYEPLDKGPDEMEHQQRIAHIIEQYARILENKWLSAPHLVNGGFVDVHIRQVKADLANEV
jgi:lauroyl/myristoyl acyltransferase